MCRRLGQSALSLEARLVLLICYIFSAEYLSKKKIIMIAINKYRKIKKTLKILETLQSTTTYNDLSLHMCNNPKK